MRNFYKHFKNIISSGLLLMFLASPAIINGQQAIQTPLLTPEVSFDPSFHEGWIWVDGTYQWTTTISNDGTSSLEYEFPGFVTGSPPPGYITDVSPATGVIPAGGSEEVLISWDASGYPPGDYSQDLHCETNDPLNLDVYIGNLMHVYMPAYLSGIVTDAISLQPINGATVTVGIWQTQTLYDGSYLQAVDAGTYVHYYDKLGYESVFIADTTLVAGDTTYVDIELMPESYPVPWVTSTVASCNEPTTVLVEWGAPAGPSEIIYDDGTAEDLFCWPTANGENAVLFTPYSYPASIIGGSVFVGDGQWPSGNWMGSEFAILVYDNGGPGGLPGSIIDSIPVVVSNYGWIHFYSQTSATIDSGEFYISMKQLTDSPAAPIGIDTDVPLENRSYSKSPGGDWGLSSYQDFMIRAFMVGPTSTPISHYNIFRLSDFDPNIGPEFGTVTDLGTSNTLSYTDSDFQFLPQAWYAHAVQTVYASGDSSNWVYSNVVANDLGNVVTFIVTPCLSAANEGFVVSVNGLDYPYEVFTDTTDINGMCVFDCMWTGNIDFMIYKCGYEVYHEFSFYIDHDVTIEITMSEITHNPRDLRVDEISGVAEWDEPRITTLVEDFENSQMPPSGWQMTTNGVGWMQTDDGSSPGFIIPPTGSSYACVNDDDAGTWNDGCCDMLITPLLDLCESDNYMLNFDSYFTGANGQLATVEYSLDAGVSWINLYTLSTSAGVWEHIEIDLSAFSGANTADDFYLAFHADDGGGQASGWAIDNVDINAGLPNIPIQGYHVYLDGQFVFVSDTINYTYTDLSYAQTYTSSVAALYDCGLSDEIYETFTSYYLASPNYLQADTIGTDVDLMWVYDTAAIIGQMPDVLGFNVYRDSLDIAFMPYSGQDTSYYTDIAPAPMCYDYHVSALYDLSLYTFPGDTGESLYTGPEEACIVFGTTLPYNQDWTSGSFEPDWTAGDNWEINGQIGNPEPSAEFTWDPVLLNYSSVLLSGAFNGVFPATKGNPYVDGNFILKYDVKLNDLNASGTEHFLCEVWAEGVWHTIASYDNANGNFDWITEEIDITSITFGNVFEIRFVAEGVLSSDILSWFVDNISIERVCYPPQDLTVYGIGIYEAELNWSPPSSGDISSEWLKWDDGNNDDGIGLSGGGVFSVASHWDPDMLTAYDGQYVTKIRFFVYANVISSTYTLKVWEGPMAATLLYEEATSGLLIGDWNELTLASPVPLDVTQELWFGYTVDSPAGENPAGCDDGPGVSGYGDMISFDGLVWEPMSNFGFDLNWNLNAYIADTAENVVTDPIEYHVYFNNDGIGYEFVESTTDTSYIHHDEVLAQGGWYCYYVKAVYEDCDANSNEACWFVNINENNTNEGILIFPNPVSEILTIKSTEGFQEICLLDLGGRLLQCHALKNETQYTMNVSGYEPGVYMLRIETEEGRVVRKVVVTE